MDEWRFIRGWSGGDGEANTCAGGGAIEEEEEDDVCCCEADSPRISFTSVMATSERDRERGRWV